MTGLVRAFDLLIDSEIAVPGALPERNPREADVVIRLGSVGGDYPGPGVGSYRLGPTGLLFDAPGIARYEVDARTIIVESTPDSDPEAASALLIATALPALLWLRGSFVAHACAFRPPYAEKALAVTAPSGGGKSTLLRHVAAMNAAAVADDVLRLEPGGEDVVGSGLAGGLYLGTVPGRRFHAVDRSLSRAPVHALIGLVEGTETAAPQRLGKQAAAALLMASRHRPRIPTLLDRTAAVFAQAALLASSLSIYRMTVRRGDGPGTVAEALFAGVDMREEREHG